MKKIFTYILLFVCCCALTTCTPEFTMDDIRFVITLQSSDITQGEVVGSGGYRYKDEVTLRATAYEFYQFKEWSDGIKDNPRKVIVTRDMDLIAYFEKYNPISGKEGDYAYVDLGLPSGTLWATCNVGAKTPAELGELYAWGETTPKTEYNWDTYKHGTDYYELTKYCYEYEYKDWFHSKQTYADGRTILESEDDAATVNWGGRWCMPTVAEIDELISKCNFTWIDNYQNTGTSGYKVSSKRLGNKNYIFIPEETYSYWSSSLSLEEPRSAYYFYLDGWSDVEKVRDYKTRCNSSYIRPVLAKTYTIAATANDASMGSVAGGGTYGVNRVATLVATAAKGYQFVRWNDGNKENPRKIVVTEDVTLIALFETNLINGHEYVDLGLPSGTLWATCNVGANAPEDYGDYFAWGETTTKENYDGYVEGNYKWGVINLDDATNYGMTKYNMDDGKTILEVSDDAATATWGSNWRMPTKAEQQELLKECTWGWTDNYNNTGVVGFIVTGKNNNFIFFPSAGCFVKSSLSSAGKAGDYWSSSLDDDGPFYAAYVLSFSSSDYYKCTTASRNYGRSVRPVVNSTPDTKIYYTVTVEVDDATMGSVTGAGEYEEGSIATLTATAHEGYKFTGWNDGKTDEVTITNPYTIVVTEDVTLIATFTALTKWYTVTVETDATMGSVTGAGTYEEGTTATLTATVNEGYEFTGWSDGNKDNPRKLVVTGDIALTALFKESAKWYTITVETNATMGSVAGAGAYEEGTTATLTATANDSYVFAGWSDGNTDNPRTITVSQDMNLTAFFEKISPVSGTENGYDYVDLGLPSGTLWATCNVGATSPEDYGDYFAWGEITQSYSCEEDEYKWGIYDKSASPDYGMTKYNVTDGKTVLDAADDAAIMIWGGRWRMPTIDEQQELINNCTVLLRTINGVFGCKIIGPNGNYIFLPAVGNCFEGLVWRSGETGCYWSSSLKRDEINYAYGIGFIIGGGGVSFPVRYGDRYSGSPIRPVIGANDTPVTYTVTVGVSDAMMGSVSGSGTYKSGDMITLTATPASGYRFVKWSDEDTTNPRTIIVNEDVTLTATFAEVLQINGHEYVDLGLTSGTLWATCNVGATSPEDYGDYFAWGETTPKEIYNESTYKYCNGSYNTLTKYCTYSDYGTVDNKRTLESADDAATANWGGSWRMPTTTEQQELHEECIWVWTTLNGVNGYHVTGSNGNSIFLPVTGFYNESALSDSGVVGHYWSSSLDESGSDGAYIFELYSYSSAWGGRRPRDWGHSVRPVCSPQ